MVVIRLSRRGSKKRPFYHVVAIDKRDRRDGRCIERLGYFNPMAFKPEEVRLELHQERVEYWTSKGAQLSPRVKTLMKEFLKVEGHVPGQPIAPRPKKAQATEEAEAPAADAEAVSSDDAEAEAPASATEAPKEDAAPADDKAAAETETPAEPKTDEPAAEAPADAEPKADAEATATKTNDAAPAEEAPADDASTEDAGDADKAADA